MKKRLYFNNKIEVRKSPIHGYGVFAKEKIERNQILEECFFIPQDVNRDNYNFLFKWYENNVHKFNVIPLGYGCIYNSSETLGENNATWERNEKDKIFIFKTIKNIKKDEEIITYYGDGWWDQYHKRQQLLKKVK